MSLFWFVHHVFDFDSSPVCSVVSGIESLLCHLSLNSISSKILFFFKFFDGIISSHGRIGSYAFVLVYGLYVIHVYISTLEFLVISSVFWHRITIKLSSVIVHCLMLVYRNHAVTLLFGDHNTELRLHFFISSRISLSNISFIFRFLLVSAWSLLFISRLNVLRGRNIFKGGSL